jgi:hypothetical protein
MFKVTDNNKLKLSPLKRFLVRKSSSQILTLLKPKLKTKLFKVRPNNNKMQMAKLELVLLKTLIRLQLATNKHELANFPICILLIRWWWLKPRYLGLQLQQPTKSKRIFVRSIFLSPLFTFILSPCVNDASLNIWSKCLRVVPGSNSIKPKPLLSLKCLVSTPLLRMPTRLRKIKSLGA